LGEGEGKREEEGERGRMEKERGRKEGGPGKRGREERVS
jgi:hypothetical protein